jgi:hypothetical protein
MASEEEIIWNIPDVPKAIAKKILRRRMQTVLEKLKKGKMSHEMANQFITMYDFLIQQLKSRGSIAFKILSDTKMPKELQDELASLEEELKQVMQK